MWATTMTTTTTMKMKPRENKCSQQISERLWVVVRWTD